MERLIEFSILRTFDINIRYRLWPNCYYFLAPPIANLPTLSTLNSQLLSTMGAQP